VLQVSERSILLPALAAAGSVLGCWLLYSIMRRGGQALLRKRFAPENIQWVEEKYARFGILAIAIPAVLPPPLPFKIFCSHLPGLLNIHAGSS